MTTVGGSRALDINPYVTTGHRHAGLSVAAPHTPCTCGDGA